MSCQSFLDGVRDARLDPYAQCSVDPSSNCPQFPILPRVPLRLHHPGFICSMVYAWKHIEGQALLRVILIACATWKDQEGVC